MKRYIKSSIDWDRVAHTLFEVKANDQPIDMEDYDEPYYVLKFYFYKGGPYNYELVCEEDWKSPEVDAYANGDYAIRLRRGEESKAVELWNMELQARGINKTITESDLRMARNGCYW